MTVIALAQHRFSNKCKDEDEEAGQWEEAVHIMQICTAIFIQEETTDYSNSE